MRKDERVDSSAHEVDQIDEAADKTKAIEIDDPYTYLQPKVSLFLHLQTIDVKLFQGADFDFRDQFSNPDLAGCVTLEELERHFSQMDNFRGYQDRQYIPLQNSQASTNSLLRKSTRIVDANYFQSSNGEQ